MRSHVSHLDQLHQLLERSLRDLDTDAGAIQGSEEQQLSQALERLSGRLHTILTESNDARSTQRATIPSAVEAMTSHAAFENEGPVHLVTSCDGVILMANDAAVDVLSLDIRNIGTMSVAEQIPYDEWRFIRQQLQARDASRDPMKWLVTLSLPEQSSQKQKMQCSATPMFDQSGEIAAWHWELSRKGQSVTLDPLLRFVPGLEVMLLNGRGVDDCLAKICHQLVQTFGYSFVWIATVRSGQRVRLRAQAVASSLDWQTMGPSWWAALSRQEKILAQACVASEGSLVSGDAPHTGEFSWFPLGFGLQEAFCLPFVVDGDLSGLLVVCSSTTKVFDSSVQEWLKTLGYHIAQLMARGLEIERLRLQSAVMGSVHDAMCVTDPQGRLEWVNESYTRLLGGTLQQVLGTSLRSFPHAQLQEQWKAPPADGEERGCVKTEVMEKGTNGESLVLDQVLTPLVNPEGAVTHFVVTLHDVTSRVVAEMQIKHQAYHDALTGLPNRVMFEDRLQLALAQARRNGRLLALLFLDLDNFKSINDRHGHQIGDGLLRIVAKRLVTCVRTTDTVSRLSGDEFTIILQGLDRIQDIRQVASKIVECLMPPIHIQSQDIPVQISIGIAVYPKDSTDPRRLLTIADRAMYRAKGIGGQCWHFATAEWNIV